MSHKFYDLTFTPSVKAAQTHYGTRKNYARFEQGESDFFGLTDVEKDFIEARDGFYMATVGENGQPYILAPRACLLTRGCPLCRLPGRGQVFSAVPDWHNPSGKWPPYRLRPGCPR